MLRLLVKWFDSAELLDQFCLRFIAKWKSILPKFYSGMIGRPFVIGYIARHTLTPGADGMTVMRVTGAIAFLLIAYLVGNAQQIARLMQEFGWDPGAASIAEVTRASGPCFSSPAG